MILCFYNEEWFALLRSVWGVIMTSPEELVDEILLVDDGSTMQHLGQMLDDYLASMPFLKVGHSQASAIVSDGEHVYPDGVIPCCAININRLNQTRVVRAGKRIGLIQARLLGAKSSRDSPGRVLIFLDSHIEPVIGWVRCSLLHLRSSVFLWTI